MALICSMHVPNMDPIVLYSMYMYLGLNLFIQQIRKVYDELKQIYCINVSKLALIWSIYGPDRILVMKYSMVLSLSHVCQAEPKISRV